MLLIFLFNYILYLFLSSNSDKNNIIQNICNSSKNFSEIPCNEEKKFKRLYFKYYNFDSKIHHLNIIQFTWLASTSYIIDEKNNEENII